MKNFLLSLLILTITAIIVPYNEPLLYYLWLIPILLVVVIQLIFAKKIYSESNENVRLKDIVKAKALNSILLICLFGILYAIFSIFPKSRSFNTFILPIFLALNLNVIRQSFGFKICKIKIKNDSFSSKLKILINNFFVVSPLYLVMLKINFPISENVIKILAEVMLLLNILNLCTRMFVFKKNSLLEKILHIEYVSL